MEENQTNSAPIIGLACGILSLFFLPLLFATIAIIIGASNKEGTGKFGMVLGIISYIIQAIIFMNVMNGDF